MEYKDPGTYIPVILLPLHTRILMQSLLQNWGIAKHLHTKGSSLVNPKRKRKLLYYNRVYIGVMKKKMDATI